MRSGFSEIEFQFAVMMGYYATFFKQDDLNFYMPTAAEEKNEFASDWVYETPGIHLYMQFKNSKEAANIRKVQRNDYFISSTGVPLSRKECLFAGDKNGVYEFEVYKKDNEYQQHNLLFNNGKSNSSLAFYVAPIFTLRIELLENLKNWLKEENGSRELFYYLINMENIHSFEFSKDNFSFFNEVVYIEPHKKITDDSNHHYCFNKSRDISFHSEINALENNGFTFLEVMKKVIVKLEAKKDVKLTTLVEEADKNLEEIKNYFRKFDNAIVRDYILETILSPSEDKSVNILTELDLMKLNKDYNRYIFIINSLYKKIFNIEIVFISNTHKQNKSL